jgi:TonB family protein
LNANATRCGARVSAAAGKKNADACDGGAVEGFCGDAVLCAATPFNMKARKLLLLASLCFSVGAAAAIPGYTPMKIIQTEPTYYPRAVENLGIIRGEARVSIQVDERGNLTDQLVTGYTHKAFADAATFAVKKWKYEPAWLNGEARGVTAELTFTFESHGLTIVNLTPTSYVEIRDYELRPNSYAYGRCSLRQLDRIPTPVKVVKPPYPVDASKKPRSADVTVTFYIDEQGRVRLPAVSPETSVNDEIFAAVAVDSVSKWEFEPPMSNGRPVLVFAQQDFNFRPESEHAILAAPAKP